MPSGQHVKGDYPLSVRLGSDREWWVRDYAVEHDMSMGEVIKAAVDTFRVLHTDPKSATLD